MPSIGANLIIDSPAEIKGSSSGVPPDAILAEDGVDLVTEDDISIVTEDGS